jgi:hypothetical protein
MNHPILLFIVLGIMIFIGCLPGIALLIDVYGWPKKHRKNKH